ncbi:DUF2865 domain-containing protein [Roseibium denhamense]|uniref:DUF2865 domain-containing protein n=1 Tax=Roseibium denhamense TaxID=76305 RepID=A0ABY1NUC6_9HYPH|nr:DUF2865 domain-containing protein [Roseibium denhamense]MTI05459.1 DUF2865 domain-containing protein [Roseibium denhamense]SMP18573.1 Protein of unknown function [Roseibium denhamense]
MRLRFNAKSTVCIAFAYMSAALALAGAPAHAASCSALQSELRQLEKSAGKASPAAQKWLTAKRQQSAAIKAAERDARHFDCPSAGGAKCDSLSDKISRMRNNLAAIERQIAKSGGSSGSGKRLRQVRAAIAKQNCNSSGTTRQAESGPDGSQTSPRSLLARLFNPQPRVELAAADPQEQTAVRKRRSAGAASSKVRLPSGGTFRTLCVRTCDGYFFPVSFSTGKSQFANDAARCSEICPASNTELYVYRNPGGDQADMMSLAGSLYTEQPFAYRYKSEFVEGCSCRLPRQTGSQSRWTEVSGSASGSNRIFFTDISQGLPRRSLQLSRGRTVGAENDTSSPLARAPLMRDQLPAYADPDTLINLEKGFKASARLEPVMLRLTPASAQVADASSGGLPLLGNRYGKNREEEVAGSPVFKSDDPGFRPAPDRDIPVRVVGPEFFVAQ